jgi:hypothetical protein
MSTQQSWDEIDIVDDRSLPAVTTGSESPGFQEIH